MRSHSRALFAVAALFAFLVAPTTAFAGKPVNDFFGTGGNGAGQFGGFLPGGLAVNQSTGDLYAFDQFNSRVQRFDEDGNYLSQFGEAGSGNGQLSVPDPSPPAQIAIDQSDGSVYVADSGNNRIQKFEADGDFVSIIDTAAGSPVSETFSEPKGVAVGTDGTLYVADTGNKRIAKFDSSGAYLIDLPIPVGVGDGELNDPVGIAIDSAGAIYIHEAPDFSGRVQKFSAAGSFEYALSPGEELRGVTTDTTNDHVFVSGINDIYEFDATGALQDTHHVDPSGASLGFVSLAVNDEGGPIYGVNVNGNSPGQNGTWILILDEPGIPVPSATIDPITTFDSDSASLSGSVNPNGNVAANWRFQVSSDGGSTWRDVGSGGTVLEGTTAEELSSEATDLEPNTTYQVRLVASKLFVSGQGIDSTSFTTEAVPPVVSALYPGPVTDSSAWLGAYVNPNNSPTTFYVEYSTDPGFASSVSVPVSEDSSAGSDGVLTLANQLISGLESQTTYHYRVIATNEVGTVTGESRSFTTLAVLPTQGLPDGRVWEKVSPADKSGANINAGNFSTIRVAGERAQAAIGGDAVTFGSAGKFGGAEGAPTQSQYLARREPGGWSTEAINPPMDPALGFSLNLNYFQWFSDDLSRGAVMTHAALNPGDPKDVYNLYLRDNESSTYTTLSDNDASTEKGAFSELRGASADGEHFLFRISKSGATGDFQDRPLMERLLDGTVRPVSVLPNGTAVEADLGSGTAGGRAPGFNAISDDGSRIFFETPENGGIGQLYVREDGATTTPISASERSGDDPDAAMDGDFLGAAADGSVAFFRAGESLTDDTPDVPISGCDTESSDKIRPPRICHLYRWNADAPAGDRLSNLTLGDPKGTQVLGMVAISDDGTSVYFAAFGNLDGNGSPTDPNLYLWREGEGVRFVARLMGGSPAEPSDLGLWTRGIITIEVGTNPFNNEHYKPARVTPDGRFLTFSTHVPQTAYDTGGKQAIYLYDSHTGRITCVSCGVVESKSNGDSWFVSCGAEYRSETRCGMVPIDHFSRNFRGDGKRLIFDSRDALVPEDTNGVTDVYEWQEGRLYLLSSGTSAFPSRFVDASADGDDVFFTTAQRLTPSDKDQLRDLYDARVGGVSEPNVTPPCVADECQGTPKAASSFQTPSSSGFEGAGNASSAKPRCGKAKVRRQGRCVRRKAGKRVRTRKQKARANEDRRAKR